MQKWEYCVLVWEEKSDGTPDILDAADLVASAQHMSEEEAEAFFASTDYSALNFSTIPSSLNKGWIEFFAEDRTEQISNQPAAITRLGSEGWEMVSATFVEDQELMYFKKPIEAPSN